MPLSGLLISTARDFTSEGLLEQCVNALLAGYSFLLIAPFEATKVQLVCQCPLSGLLISTLDSRKPHSIRAAKAKIARVFQTVVFFVTICQFFCFFEIEVFFITHLILFSPLFLFYHSYSVMPTNFFTPNKNFISSDFLFSLTKNHHT